MGKCFNRERVRFHMKKENTLVIQGWFEQGRKNAVQFEAQMGEKRLPVETAVQSGVEVTKKYLRYKTNVEEEYFLMITLPGFDAPLRVFAVIDGTRTCIYRASGRALRELQGHLESWVETLRELPDGRLMLRGWYMGCSRPSLTLYERGRAVRPADCTTAGRMDILSEFPEAKMEDTSGFELTFSRPSGDVLRLVLEGESKKTQYRIHIRKMLSGREGLWNLCRKSWRYLQRKGMKQFAWRVSDVLFGQDSISYERWRRKYAVTKQELEAQCSHRFEYEPKISIVVPLYRTPEKFLREMIASVQQQTYANWELVLSDGSGADSSLQPLLEEYEKKDVRIKALHNEQQLRIAENTNAAIAHVTGAYLIFGDHDDLFAPDALYECVRVLNENPDVQMIYSDEDKVDASGKRYFEPHFKPDYSPDLLCSMNYFCHLVLVKKTLADEVGALDPAFDGAQDYDYVLRCSERAQEKQIVHIPKILYHWRSHGESTAENPESKRYAFDAGRRAIQAHYDRCQIPAVVREGEYAGIYYSRYAVSEEPLVSILIPNKDHIEDLKTCIRSIEEKSDYRNYELIIIENNSTEPETFEAYRQMEAENGKIRVIYYEGKKEFNYSEINNFGARHARGEYYLLLNNDTEMIRPDCIRELLGYCQRPDVGIVGALLFYEDDTIQHAGVVLGFGGIAGHAFIGEKRGSNGYFSRIICAQNYSAVTAACMMVKASVFWEVDGLSANLKVAFNDIDFCMKVRSRGYHIVYNPQAQLYHYESKSRGLENTQEKIERFNREMACFLSRWGSLVEAGDPYYNPNLTLDKADFSLKL